jgi:hypothetical protein
LLIALANNIEIIYNQEFLVKTVCLAKCIHVVVQIGKVDIIEAIERKGECAVVINAFSLVVLFDDEVQRIRLECIWASNQQ